MYGLCFKRPAPRNGWELPNQPRHLLSHFPFFKIKATLIPLCLRFRNQRLVLMSPRATSYQVTCCFQKNCPFNTSANQAIQVVWATEKRRDSEVSRAESWRFHPGEHAPKKQSIVPGCSWLLNSVSVFPSISMYFLVAWLSSCDLHLHLLPALMKFMTTHKIRTSPSAPPAP